MDRLAYGIDLLGFLRTGEVLPDRAADSKEFVAEIAQTIPQVWDIYQRNIENIDFDQIARNLGDEPPGDATKDASKRIIRGFIVGAQSLNLSTGNKPCRMEGHGKDEWLALLTGINRNAKSSIGKPLFDIEMDRSLVRYLGLWSTPLGSRE